MWNDFKKFAFKGNVLDLAVGVVIGTAFTAVVNVIVSGIIMPVVGAITPKAPWQTWSLWKLEIGQVMAAALNFLIVAFVLFIVVSRFINAIKRHEEAAPAAPPPEPPADIKLLTEIRDLLKSR
jgi:large conductance mechanosensitive channel